MKRSLSGLDLIALTKELQSLANSRLDKVYQPKKDEIEISISSKGEGKLRLRVKLSGWIWLGKATEEMPTLPSSFASQLRKYISNARIIGISQRGCERIIEFALQKETDSRLIFELFAEGNVILVSDNSIIALLKRRRMKHRELKQNGPYLYPPETFDPMTASKEQFVEALKASNADIVRTLATKINLGGDYAEEVCLRAGIEKNRKIADIEASLIEKAWQETRSLLKRLESEPSPRISYENGKTVNVSPIELLSDQGRDTKEYATFSEAIDYFVSQMPVESEEGVKSGAEKSKLDRMLATQKKALENLTPEIESAYNAAEFLFANYEGIEKIIAELREGLSSGSLPTGVEIVDRAKRRFRISIGETELVLNWKKSVTENAQDFYESVKRTKSKLEGVAAAIEETIKKIDELKAETTQKQEEARKMPRKGPTAWYDRYRWFVSSEGALIVAGKDAKGNDQLVKKHLQPGDRYVHADIHGAPSVVVKKEEGMTEATLREAAVFSLSMSKAWNAGIGSGSAYWVTPEQVSKTPQSGEFLPKGAFVIRGKRNYFEKLEMKLAIGKCKSPADRLMCGPVEAVSKNCDDYVLIEHGDSPKEKVAKELARRFSANIEELQALLPPGRMKWRPK